MSVRLFFVAMVSAIVTSSCGRIGYDEIAGPGGPGGTPEGGGTAPGPDGQTAVGNGGEGFSSGGSNSGGAIGNGGTDGALAGGGSVVASGGGPGAGAAIGSGGTLPADAAVGGGGALGAGGAIASGGVVGNDAAVAPGGAVGSGGTGGAAVVGCADGQREGFLDAVTYPDIAACDGGFAVPGTVGLTGPACARGAGDDGALPDGAGCNVEDLCALGFHVCVSAAEVGAKSSTGCTGAAAGATTVFYVTLQSGGGQQKCGAGTNDVFGCGTMGYRAGVGCSPLDAASGDLCSALTPPWSCGSDMTAEAINVVKPGASAGGVLCCRD